MGRIVTTFVLVCALGSGCGDDSGSNNNNTADPCTGVDCGANGSCVDNAGQAECDCDPGYAPQGLTCVESANTAPEITSAPASDATTLLEYTYDVVCTDGDADDLTLALGPGDTCGGAVADNGDGTGSYTFTPDAADAGTTCTLEVVCDDTLDSDTQTESVDIGYGSLVCTEDTTFTGQVYIPAPPDPTSAAGGVYTSTPYPTSYDAGVAALRALVPTTMDATAAVDITLTEATISASGIVSLSNMSFWITDGNASLKVWLPYSDTAMQPPFAIRVGQKITVRVTEVLNYQGTLEITRVDGTSWSLVSSDNEVAVPDRTGGPPLTAADIDSVVRLTGVIIGHGFACTLNHTCYQLDFGAGQNANYRTASTTDHYGQCVTWVGPVSARNNVPELRNSDDDWVRIH